MKKAKRNPTPPDRAKSALSGSSWFARHQPVLRFLSLFVILLGGFYALVLVPAVDRLYFDYLRANAWLADLALRGLGQHTEVHDVTIRAAQFTVSVRRGCDAVEPAWFFCAAILAFPSPWRRKLAPLALGVPVLLALNLVRITSLFFIGSYLPSFFEPAHLELWPAVFIVLALVLWVGWIRSNLKSSSSHA
jgi:exosortase H (IPTLxxWG-CTERM-specific)